MQKQPQIAPPGEEPSIGALAGSGVQSAGLVCTRSLGSRKPS